MKSKSVILRNLCWIVALAVAVGFIAYGCAREEWEIVWNKAVNVCTECIGLG